MCGLHETVDETVVFLPSYTALPKAEVKFVIQELLVLAVTLATYPEQIGQCTNICATVQNYCQCS